MIRQYIRVSQLAIMLIFRVFFRLVRKPVFINSLGSPLKRNDKVVFICNHQEHLDPPAIFSTVSLKFLFSTAPVRFLTWWRYYWSPLMPIFVATGGFPTHGPGKSGIKGMIHHANNGYRTFIFPEGKREIKRTSESKPYKGVSLLLEGLPDARVVLLRIKWEKRVLSKPRPWFVVHAQDAPTDLDRSDPQAIMNAIYSMDSII